MTPTPGAAPALGRRTYEKGLQTFVWKARDENDDRLQYDVYYRKEGDSAWRLLRRAFSDALLTWDTTSVPDGTYSLRVVASDAPSSSPATALSGERESTSFDVDNTPPVIVLSNQRTEGGRVVLSLAVHDGQSAVQRVEYSTDASRWQVVYPVDGLADAREEHRPQFAARASSMDTRDIVSPRLIHRATSRAISLVCSCPSTIAARTCPHPAVAM